MPGERWWERGGTGNMKTEDLAECDLQAGARVALGSSQTC